MPKKQNTKRADGLIAVQVYLGKVDGKRKYKTVYGKTQKEAENKAREVKNKLDKNADVSASVSLSDWCKHYLALKKTTCSPSRYKLISSQVKIWDDNLGEYSISKIKPIDIKPIVDRIAKKNPYTLRPSSKFTVQTYLNALKGIYDYAIENRVVEYNPAMYVQLPKTVEPEQRRALSATERNIILNFKHRGQTAMMLMMFSGLRKGEATALKWEDVDLNNKTITVNKSYDYKNKCIKPPKNGKSRLVVIPDILNDYLKKLSKSSTFVITNAQGNMMTEQSWKRLIESYLYQLNDYCIKNKLPSVEPFTYHCLRHTFCTLMYESEVDAVVAQAQMGHSDIKTTLSIYTHLSAEHKKNDIAKLNDFLNNASNNASKIS